MKKLFSITKKDLDIQYFRAGKHGGQKGDKTSSACRIRHLASGAEGLSRDERSKEQNRKIAFRRLVESDKFKAWLRLEAAARLQGYRDLEDKIDELMKPENIKVEIGNGESWEKDKDGNGRGQ
jgi:protein subunit release factor B